RVSSTLDEGDVAAVHPARTRAAISSRLRKGIWFPPVGSTGHAQVDNIASPPRAVEPPADPYSARSATTGSTCDARRAGIQLAASATPTSTAIAVAYAAGCVGATPKSMLSSTRPAATARATPST